MTAELRAALRAIGPVLNSDATRPLYAALQAAQPRDGVEVTSDLAYGAHARQILDVYRPTGAVGRPVVVYVHGGGFVHGEKTTRSNGALLFARSGLVSVHLTYRLAPEHPYPAGADDVAAAYAWVKANIASHGGDSSRIVLIGESAGASHSITAAFTSALPAELRPDPLGLALISGVFDPNLDDAVNGAVNWREYFPADRSLRRHDFANAAAASPTRRVLLTFAELDPVPFHVGASVVFAQLATVPGLHAEIDMILDHSHISQLYAMNTADDVLGPRLLRWINEVVGPLA